MTRLASAEVTCPACKHSWKAAIHASVNVTLDPALKPRVINGDIFRLTCPSCGHTEHAQYDCLYHDMQKPLMISLTSPADLERKIAALSAGSDTGVPWGAYTLRVVHSVLDLWEKIFVFDAELNDGIVELCKIILPGQNPDLKGAALRFQAIDDAGQLAFAVIRPNTRPEFVSVPRDYYDAVRTKAFADLAAIADEKGQWLKIDYDLIRSFMATRQAGPP